MFKQRVRLKVAADSRWVGFYFVFWLSYFSYFWWNLFTYDGQGGLSVGQANVWADWALHFSMGNSMAYRELFLTQSPLLIDNGFSYPFAINLISALLVKAGAPMVAAFVWPSYLFSLVLIYALYTFLEALFEHRTIAVLGGFLFFFNGGIGFYYFFQEVLAADSAWVSLLNPLQETTHLAQHQIKWMSIISSTIIPQRSFTMGFALTLLSLAMILRAFHLVSLAKRKNTKKISLKYIPAALILGFMPIIHMHSFLAAFIFLCCWCFSDLIAGDSELRFYRFKHWLVLVVIVSLIALPLLKIYYFDHLSQAFISWFPGWYAKEFNMSWLVFWFKNWTLVPILAFASLLFITYHSVKKQQTVRHVGLYLPAFIIFLLVNLMLFQPWIWDNSKLIAWTSVGFSGLVAMLIYALFIWHRHWSKTILLSILMLLLMLSGLIDSYRNIRFDLHRYLMYSKNEFELAQWVKRNTSIDSIWLIANKHNHWLSNLTGRQVVMSYDGWLWSHGYDYREIKRDVEIMFKAADRERLKKYRIDYVVLGAQTLKHNPFRTMLWAKKFIMVKQQGHYRIFKISH